MNISLLTDAPKHNLALMQLSAYHKALGDTVNLNMPLWKADKTYASILFEWNKNNFIADEYGGPGVMLGSKVKPCYPDYELFPIDYSLGYTYRYCIRRCPFCKVWKMETSKEHHSIHEFYNTEFKKICLLNNNTFSDPEWKATFEEIWDANLTVVDENGYDLRLIDSEKADALKRTKWDGSKDPHFAWDQMKDEAQIIKGLEEVNRVGFKHKSIYVLIGYDTTLEEDIYRCQKIHDMGHDPFPMIYEAEDSYNQLAHDFRRMIYQRYYRKIGNIEKAWKGYKR